MINRSRTSQVHSCDGHFKTYPYSIQKSNSILKKIGKLDWNRQETVFEKKGVRSSPTIHQLSRTARLGDYG